MEIASNIKKIYINIINYAYQTEAFWIGTNCGEEEITLPGRNFKWPKFKVKALGVWFLNSIDPEIATDLNYHEKLNNVRNILMSEK